LGVKLVNYKDCNKMHGQQNIKLREKNSFPRLFKDKASSRLVKGVNAFDIYSCYTIGSWQEHELYWHFPGFTHHLQNDSGIIYSETPRPLNTNVLRLTVV